MITSAVIAAFLVSFARSAAFLQAFPLTGDRIVPPKLRLAIAALLALAVAPGRAGLDAAGLAAALPAEIVLGLAAGFAGRAVLAGAEAGGQLIGLQLGLGFAATFDRSVAEEELPTRRIIRCIAALAFLGAGGLETALAALAAPPATGTTLAAAAAALIAGTADVLVLGVRLAAPALAAALIANLAAA